MFLFLSYMQIASWLWEQAGFSILARETVVVWWSRAGKSNAYNTLAASTFGMTKHDNILEQMLSPWQDSFLNAEHYA